MKILFVIGGFNVLIKIRKMSVFENYNSEDLGEFFRLVTLLS